MRHILCIVLGIALALDFSGSTFVRAQSDADPVSRAIQTQFDRLMDPNIDTVHGARIALVEPVREFYTRRDFRPAWSNSRNAQQLRKALAESENEGLDPEDYHRSLLDTLSQQVENASATDALRAEYDVLLTEALLRLAYHLSFGKVDPETFDSQWNYGRTLAEMNVAQEVESALAAEDIYERVEALKPTHRLYVELKAELARYRAIAAKGDRQPIAAGDTIKPGASDSRLPELRARLIASGDLAASQASESIEYDSSTADAIRAFQRRMGLDADAVIGRGTVAELNRPAAERIRQIRVNLDRGRVLLQDLPREFVVVNIAGYTTYFVRGEQIVWEGRAQVGRPYRRTPIFRSEISYVVFNPTWTVPPGIIEKDILPAAKKDPSSIARKGLRVIDASGREVAPDAVDWSRYTSGHIPYTLRQDPGPSNALGRVKLMFPNPYLVYLHDTPSQALFERAERTFSSGCVRVERALELARLVLNDEQRWNETTIATAIAAEKPQNVTLKSKIPVLLAYWTAWVDPQGAVNFRRDIYDQDAKWAQALDADFKMRAKPLFSITDKSAAADRSQ